jgi:hypothetical protein
VVIGVNDFPNHPGIAAADGAFAGHVLARVPAWERFSAGWRQDAPLFGLTTPKT